MICNKQNILGEKIRDTRIAARLSQLAFGKLLGVNQTAISSWEVGRNSPSFKPADKLLILAKKHGINLLESEVFSCKKKIQKHNVRK